MIERTSRNQLWTLFWFVPTACGVAFIGLLAFGLHGDNWSVVLITGKVLDAQTGLPLEGVTICEAYNLQVPGCGDITHLPKTDTAGQFELKRKFHWAVYLFRKAYYQPFELDLEREGYRTERFPFPQVKVIRAEVPGQVIDVGEIHLRQNSSGEK